MQARWLFPVQCALMIQWLMNAAGSSCKDSRWSLAMADPRARCERDTSESYAPNGSSFDPLVIGCSTDQVDQLLGFRHRRTPNFSKALGAEEPVLTKELVYLKLLIFHELLSNINSSEPVLSIFNFFRVLHTPYHVETTLMNPPFTGETTVAMAALPITFAMARFAKPGGARSR